MEQGSLQGYASWGTYFLFPKSSICFSWQDSTEVKARSIGETRTICFHAVVRFAIKFMWVVSSKKNRLSQRNGGYFDWLRCYQTAPNDMHINGHPHDDPAPQKVGFLFMACLLAVFMTCLKSLFPSTIPTR